MARPSRSAPARTVSSDDDDDEFPDIEALVRQKRGQSSGDSVAKSQPVAHGSKEVKTSSKPPIAVRRRKLGQIPDNNALLRSWTPDSGITFKDDIASQRRPNDATIEPRRPSAELRTRKTRTAVSAARPAAKVQPVQDDPVSEQEEEVTITEEVSVIADGSCDSSDSGGSIFEDAVEHIKHDSDSDSDDDLAAFFARRPPAKPRIQPRETRPSRSASRELVPKQEITPEKRTGGAAGRTTRKVSNQCQPQPEEKAPMETKLAANKDLTDTFSRLKLDDVQWLGTATVLPPRRKVTPPASTTPPKPPPGLVSPKKLPRIPNTPHRPSTDIFWSRDFVDEWNDEHSPRKQLFPDAKSPAKPPTAKKAGPSKLPAAAAKEAKRAFQEAKHDIAEAFLRELDTVITNGQLATLSASTGGIKLNWTNKLNTTAGRANWKRETVRTVSKPPAGTSGMVPPSTVVTHKHHASIELAEKVIDDEHRLLNVMAHEFCHLANFMVSGITTNPHGREFKAWAAKCSAAFGRSRGIDVTTKHSYDIDFKYVWTCDACAMEFKRHSKSIHPERHRCGSCKGELKQTKPVPRANGGKRSEYQDFMKEQMHVVKEENPGSPQKDIMKLVASRWALKGGKSSASSSRLGTPEEGVEVVTDGVGALEIVELSE
ncbi:SprT-like family-domain-containing protein [Podospora appendiculata]|uniref:SprT-like family-domain-containing protein n=1 Tax=Podospora appendiculata TaxID=314037 RepID=A0AAE0XC72_9PEZI|nr:SprT-like family-domain-containing protein [Podospora appendiculata]